MKDKNTVEIGVKTTGFEEATEQMELMADAMNEFPATVNIKAKECEISIHTTNYIEMAKPEPSQAKGGVRLEPDLDEKWIPEEDEVVMSERTIKEMCMSAEYADATAQKMALLGALSLYLDFINLFLYLLRIFGRRG